MRKKVTQHIFHFYFTHIHSLIENPNQPESHQQIGQNSNKMFYNLILKKILVFVHTI